MPSLRIATLRAAGAACVLAMAAWAAGPPVQAGETGSRFAITITTVPEGSGTCSASTAQGSPQVTCRPTLGGVVGPAADARESQVLLAYRRTDGALRLAGEMTEVGHENHYAWTDGVPPDMAAPEYSTEVVSENGRAYLQYTVAW